VFSQPSIVITTDLLSAVQTASPSPTSVLTLFKMGRPARFLSVQVSSEW
jgi:hypothetical protein